VLNASNHNNKPPAMITLWPSLINMETGLVRYLVKKKSASENFRAIWSVASDG